MGHEWLQEALWVLTHRQPTRGDGCDCCRHACSCLMLPETFGKYHLEISSAYCQPWSLFGRGLGLLDDRMECALSAHRSSTLSACVRHTKYSGDFPILCPPDFGPPDRNAAKVHVI